MTPRFSRRPAAVVLGLAVLFAASGVGLDPAAAEAALAGWTTVDYAELVDRRQPSHSGDPVGVLLDRLEGRPRPSAGERPEDRLTHSLLDPLLESYAFVLPDALDRQVAVRRPPYVEVGSLWRPGEEQPAWVELLRARRLILESDGQGHLRAILPWEGDLSAADAAAAAQEAWAAAWPIVRHVLAAERLRRKASGADAAPSVEVHAYRHEPERSVFRLGLAAWKPAIEDTRPDGLRPPLDLDRIERFLAANLVPEGARIDEKGSIRLLGSQSDEPARLLGRPLSLADFAVAYRAVFHGGLSEPYMSLDRGYSPQTFVVNYGGRLRDTALGWVSLLCDIRFKTFSLGLDIVRGQDLRATLRATLPDFGSHLEHFARHPDSRALIGQQTRMWFYPDAVDLTLSPQGDVFVMRRVRMSAASERMQEGGIEAQQAEEHPWTRTTVDAINRDYDTLSRFFPEMADLDQVVRLLSMFAWLKQAEDAGFLLPELEALLAIPLPRLSTPRAYPQLLAFNALPPPDSESAIVTIDRVEIAEALDRLGPVRGRPLDARRRYQRAVAALDPASAEQAALLAELQGFEPESLDEARLDLLSHRAERMRMHQLVLGTLDAERRRELGSRLQQGEDLRIFSVGIGGLDLDMTQALRRARARGGEAAPLAVTAAPTEPVEAWRDDAALLPRTALPDHGLDGVSGRRLSGDVAVEIGTGAAGEWILTVYGTDGPEVRSRKLVLDDRQHAASFERLEDSRFLRYRFDTKGTTMTARRVEGPPATDETPPATGETAPPPPGLAFLRVDPPAGAPLESPGVPLRLESSVDGSRRTLEAEFPRAALQRLVLGHEADRTPGRPLPGLAPLPEPLGPVSTVMTLPDVSRWRPPWEARPANLAGEEDPLSLARALSRWWAGSAAEQLPASVVGVDPARSPERWSGAPSPGPGALLILPASGFDGVRTELRRELVAAWGAEGVVTTLPPVVDGSLVVLISAEPPARFGRRLRELSRDARMQDRLLAAWCLAGPIRTDLAGSLLAEGRLAGLGLARTSVVLERRAGEEIARLQAALARAGKEPRRAERLPGPFLWHY